MFICNEQSRRKMIETIKHLLGLCGEPHGLMYFLLLFGGSVSGMFAYLKQKNTNAKKEIH